MRSTTVSRSSLALVALSLLACSAPQSSTRTGASTATSTHAPWHPTAGATIEQLLNVHRAWHAYPSRDGHLVAFASDAPGVAQPFYAEATNEPAAESAWHRIASFADRTDFVALTADDRSWLFGHDHGGDENVQIFRQPVGAAGEPQDLSQQPRVKFMFGTLRDDGAVFAYASNERTGADFDLYVRAVDGATPARRVFDARGHFEARDFSPDGQLLLAIEERSGFDHDIHVIDLATGVARRLTAHQGDERFDSPQFGFERAGANPRTAPAIYVLSDRGREYVNLARLDESGLHFLADDDHDVDYLAVSHSTDAMAIATNVDGYHHIRLLTQGSAPHDISTVDLPPLVVSDLRFSADGRALAVTGSRASRPDEVYLVDVATGHSRRVTASDHAGLDESALVEPEFVRVPSFDGVEIPLMIYRPRNLAPGARAPVVVSVHGGPESQATPVFSPVTQYLVGHGYIVVTPNVRGSTGYGKRFAHLDDRGHREDSVRDLHVVNEWLRHRPDVDPTRLAVMGGSYGGYMTLAAITLYPEDWSVACDIVGIANFRTFLERTAAYRRALREAEYGFLATDGEMLDRVSPIHRVDRIRTPLMVIHGTNDPRVPVTEAEQIVAALRGRQQRVEYLRFDNEGHGLSRRENRIRGYGDMVRFFDDVLR